MSGVGGEHGCGSTACIFDAPSVGVPSPCACLDDTPRETRVRVRKAVYKRKGVVARLRAEVERLTTERDDARRVCKPDPVECTTCDADGLFRVGAAVDVCGYCLGTKRIPPTPGGEQ